MGCEGITRLSADSSYFEHFKEKVFKFSFPSMVKLVSCGFGLCMKACIDLTNTSTPDSCRVLIEDTRFADCQKSCIIFGSKKPEDTGMHLKVSKCNFSYNLSRGVDGAGYLGSLSIVNCEFERNANDGIRLTDLNVEAVISGNKFEQNCKYAVECSGTSSRITENEVIGGSFGFKLEGYSELIDIYDSCYDSNKSFLGQSHFITRNTISQNSGSGIILRNGQYFRAEVKDNIIRGCLNGVLIDEVENLHQQTTDQMRNTSGPNLRFLSSLNYDKNPSKVNRPGKTSAKTRWNPSSPMRGSMGDNCIDESPDCNSVKTASVKPEIILIDNNLFDNWFMGVNIRSTRVPINIVGGKISGNQRASIGYSSQSPAYEITVGREGSERVDIDKAATQIDLGLNVNEISLQERSDTKGCLLI